MSIARRRRSCAPRCAAIPATSRAGSCSRCLPFASVTRPGRMTPVLRRAWPHWLRGWRGRTPGERYALAVDAIIRPRGTAAESAAAARLVQRAWPDGLLPRGALGGAAVNLINAYALDDAEAWLERIFGESRELGLPVARLQASTILGSCLRLRGALPAAERAAARGLRRGRRHGARSGADRGRRARHRARGSGSGGGGRRRAGGLRPAGARAGAHARQRPAVRAGARGRGRAPRRGSDRRPARVRPPPEGLGPGASCAAVALDRRSVARGARRARARAAARGRGARRRAALGRPGGARHRAARDRARGRARRRGGARGVGGRAGRRRRAARACPLARRARRRPSSRARAQRRA